MPLQLKALAAPAQMLSVVPGEGAGRGRSLGSGNRLPP